MDFSGAYSVLKKVYGDGAYISEVITRDKVDDPFSVRLAYGVVERDYELTATIHALCQKQPKAPIRIMLKMGMYCIKYMDSAPAYAVTSSMVDFAKKVGKGASAGLINAVLKRYVDFTMPTPTDEVEAVALSTSVPVWIVTLLKKRFGIEETERILSYKQHRASIRINERLIDEGEALRRLNKAGVNPTRHPLGGFRVDTGKVVQKMFFDGLLTYQSPSSVYVAALCAAVRPQKVLDLCSAPGGKAVYIAEKTGAEVLACDVHAHRTELINKYASRMKTQGISTKVMDGTVRDESLVNAFDLVLVDAPCSGLGVLGEKPEALLNRKIEDVATLVGVQKRLINNAADYVKRGGYLVYSTCTLTEEENEGVVREFLTAHPEFAVDMPGEDGLGRTLLPHKDDTDGFFAVRMKKL